ncbi:hypothetical protein PGIGA_G00174790 [Pangasianodon gigas]|uniref:Uncharacterized protein n=1 Tax=Pangasianodon gigas TaxID=30993 RepID=A0ACC5XUY6_PANGG|nr:hypothetical protein [Pangasianodon gigas]
MEGGVGEGEQHRLQTPVGNFLIIVLCCSEMESIKRRETSTLRQGAGDKKAQCVGIYDRAILQRVGRTPEQHRQHFSTLAFSEIGRQFVYTQKLTDACWRWLLAEDHDAGEIINLVVLEQFVAQLLKGQRLDKAIQLAEDHLVAYPGAGEPSSSSLSLMFPLLPTSNLSLSPLPKSGGPLPRNPLLNPVLSLPLPLSRI